MPKEIVKYKHQKSCFPSTILNLKVIKPTFKCKKDLYFIDIVIVFKIMLLRLLTGFDIAYRWPLSSWKM